MNIQFIFLNSKANASEFPDLEGDVYSVLKIFNDTVECH